MSNPKSNTSKLSFWKDIIEAANTPIKFFGLYLLVCNSIGLAVIGIVGWKAASPYNLTACLVVICIIICYPIWQIGRIMLSNPKLFQLPNIDSETSMEQSSVPEIGPAEIDSVVVVGKR